MTSWKPPYGGSKTSASHSPCPKVPTPWVSFFAALIHNSGSAKLRRDLSESAIKVTWKNIEVPHTSTFRKNWKKSTNIFHFQKKYEKKSRNIFHFQKRFHLKKIPFQIPIGNLWPRNDPCIPSSKSAGPISSCPNFPSTMGNPTWLAGKSTMIVYVCRYVCMHACMHACNMLYIYIYIYIYTYICNYMCVRYKWNHVCIYIYICLHLYNRWFHYIQISKCYCYSHVWWPPSPNHLSCRKCFAQEALNMFLWLLGPRLHVLWSLPSCSPKGTSPQILCRN